MRLRKFAFLFSATWLTVIVSILIASAILGGFLWPYTLNSWLSYAGKPPTISFWVGALLGACPCIGQLSIPAAVATFVLLLFI
jgi:hypothetical protein